MVLKQTNEFVKKQPLENQGAAEYIHEKAD